MIIATIAILLAGAANFAMHRWLLESGNPMVEQATGAIRRMLGRHATYVFEFAMLILALTLAQRQWFAPLMLYGAYTGLNAATIAWLKGPHSP